MRLMLDKKEIEKFVSAVGSLATATDLIKDNLKCSESKAEKIAAGRYPSRLSPLEQIALAMLLERPVEKLFRAVS